ncbi:MAG TPA: hypothetical protein VHU79_00070 [Sphingomicrobium sp.]|nr:hypothetical protein [Sphingomicrobium sp.]
MVHLLMALLLAGPGSGSIGVNRMILRDPQQGPTPVTDKFLIPARVPDCTTPEQVQRANAERIKGWDPDCMLPPKMNSKQPQ